MKKHKKIWADFFGIGEQDCAICECCQASPVVWVHHLLYLSMGGSDDITNLLGTCDSCHKKFHLTDMDTTEWMEFAEDLEFRKKRMNRLMFGME